MAARVIIIVMGQGPSCSGDGMTLILVVLTAGLARAENEHCAGQSKSWTLLLYPNSVTWNELLFLFSRAKTLTTVHA